MIFVVMIVLRTDVMKGNTGYRIAIDHEFITKTMPSSICRFATFENEGCCVQMPDVLYKIILLA